MPLFDKVERQRKFLQRCKAKGMSSDEINRAASIIPQNAIIKVLKWPKL